MEAAVVRNLKRLALKFAKFIFFVLLSLVIGRTLGNPELWINHTFADSVAGFIYGEGNVNAETIYDTYFYLSFIFVLSLTFIIYLSVVKFINKIRSR